MSTTTTYTGVRIVDMPDLGVVTDASSMVGERSGSGRFSATELKSYILAGPTSDPTNGTTGAFSSIAALRANTSTLYQAAVVAGYATIADGAGGVFSLNASDTTTADNGGTIIVDAAHQRWYRLGTAAGINVRWFGAKGDAATNDTAAFNAATAAASALGGGTVLVPVGRYLIDPIVLPAYVSLSGIVEGPFDPTVSPAIAAHGAVLLVNSTATAFIQMHDDCVLSDVIIFYPQQVPPSASAPNVYPPCVSMLSVTRVLRCTLVNPYIGIDVKCGRSVISDCKIGSYLMGINIDLCQDTVTIDRCWIGAYFETAIGQAPFQPIDTWNLTNGRCIVVGRCDGLYVDQLACGGRLAGLYFSDGTGSGVTCGYGKLSNIDIDTVQYGVICYAANNGAGGYAISNMTVGLWGTTGGSSTGVSYLALASGGSQAPMILWNGGGVRGTFSTGLAGMQTGVGSAWISNVRGYNPERAFVPPTMPASNGTIANPFPCRVQVNMVNINTCAINGSNTGLTSPQSVELSPGDLITVAYTGTPSWTWFGLL